MITIAIRTILTLALIYGAYTETGIWTAIALFLLFLSTEGLVFYLKQLIRQWR